MHCPDMEDEADEVEAASAANEPDEDE